MQNSQSVTLESTYKSLDTEEWLDIHFTRPIGFLWARLFARWHVHPNTVTFLSIVLGVAAAVMFYFPDVWHNLAGVLLLMWANFYDSADGQLARMTNQKTRLGRILDGAAGEVWFISIYVALALRLCGEPIPFTHHAWGLLIFVIVCFSGFVCHARQCALADYYRNIHLYFLRGADHSELDTSAAQRAQLKALQHGGPWVERLFQFFYVNYVEGQEKRTPCFQRLMSYIKSERGGRVPQAFRDDFCRESRPLMTYANIITFNWRAITLYATCLLNVPWLYFLIEILVFSAIAFYLKRRHERMCRHFLTLLQNGHYDAAVTTH